MRATQYRAHLGKHYNRMVKSMGQRTLIFQYTSIIILFCLSLISSVFILTFIFSEFTLWSVLGVILAVQIVNNNTDKSQESETGTNDLEGYSIIIPVYNEEDGIIPVLAEVVQAIEGSNAEVVIVDDGSSDKSIELTTKFVNKQKSQLKIVRHPQNKGYGSALKTGFTVAKNDIITFLDADGTYPSAFIPTMINLFRKRNLDILVGSRLAGTACEMPWIRKIGNKAFAFLMSLYSGTRVSDVGSGMRVMNRSLLNKIGDSPDGLFFTPYMTAQVLLQNDIRYGETPITYHERIGVSKLNVFRDGWNFFKAITIPSWRKKPFRVFIILLILLLALFTIITIVGILIFRILGSLNIIF